LCAANNGWKNAHKEGEKKSSKTEITVFNQSSNYTLWNYIGVSLKKIINYIKGEIMVLKD